MTLTEFSNEFDSLIRTYSEDLKFGKQDIMLFNEYEKSVFLTKAQEEIVIELYTGRNSTHTAFEETEELRRYLSNLVCTARLEESETKPILPYSYTYKLPDDIMFITYENLQSNKDLKIVSVYPVSQDEVAKILKNPFRGPSKNRVLRLDLGKNVELIPPNDSFNMESYMYLMRYIRKPKPIILVNLPEDVTINNISTTSECELDSSLHRKILDRAVLLAIQSMYSKK